VSVTDQLDIVPLPVRSIPFRPFRFQWIFVRNRTTFPINGPLAFVLENVGHAVTLSAFHTRCSSTQSNPFAIIVPGADNVLTPNEVALAGFWFFKTEPGPITYTAAVLGGIPRR